MTGERRDKNERGLFIGVRTNEKGLAEKRILVLPTHLWIPDFGINVKSTFIPSEVMETAPLL
jgi:hypothetical protein